MAKDFIAHFNKLRTHFRGRPTATPEMNNSMALLVSDYMKLLTPGKRTMFLAEVVWWLNEAAHYCPECGKYFLHSFTENEDGVESTNYVHAVNDDDAVTDVCNHVRLSPPPNPTRNYRHEVSR
jgi:hypothetical protein